MSKNMQAIPKVGMPAMRTYLPSDAPVDIVGTTGSPGHIVERVCSRALVSSGRSADGGTVTIGISFPSAVFSGIKVTLTLGSATTRSNVLCNSSGSSPGKILQLTVARADCGSALGACPPASMVATQVVRNSEL